MKKNLRKSILILFILSLLIMMLLNCPLSFNSSDNDDEKGSTIKITVIVSPPSGATISKSGENAKIVVTFSESMKRTTLNLTGDMTNDNIIIEWSTSTQTDDRLTISPQDEWTTGTNKTLIIDCDDIAGNKLTTLSLSYNIIIIGSIVYVSDSNGDDDNLGTISHPKKTIQAGINLAEELPYSTVSVYVAQGTYSSSYNEGTGSPVVYLHEGISIYGGYTTDFTNRDTSLYKTIINDMSSSGGSVSNPNRAIHGDGSSTSITDTCVIDGFYINGGGGDYSSAIFNHNGASPTIQNSVINGGNGNQRSYGIRNNDTSSPSIFNNTISGGNGVEYSYGVRNDTLSLPIIQNNIIDGGSCDKDSFGILNYECNSLVIQDNTIDGGTGGSHSYAIYDYYSSSTIQNNNINGGTGGTSSYSIYNYYSSSTIQNNIINGGAECISSIGIYNHYPSSPMISNNIINGGTGDQSCGINNSNSTPTIQNNTIDGGIGDSSCSTCGIHNHSSSSIIQNNVIDGGKSGSFSQGINNYGSSPVIRNNTILGGNGWFSTYGIQINSDSFPTIENNIIFTSGDGNRYGIYENGGNDDPVSVRNNDIYDCPDGLYYDYDSNPEELTDINDVNSLSDITSSGNISENISGYLDAEFRFTGALADFIFDTEGINGAHSSENWGFITDKDDNSRSPLDDSSTTGWSIGAYEY